MRCFVQTHLDAPAEKVWAAAKQSATLLYVTRGFLGFSEANRMPMEWSVGTVFQTRFWFFHVIPAWWKHTLAVMRIEANQKKIVSHEGGGMISVWNHALQKSALPSGCNYDDDIEIKAGWLTPLIWLYANVFYRYRQARWRELAKRIAGPVPYHNFFR